MLIQYLTYKCTVHKIIRSSFSKPHCVGSYDHTMGVISCWYAFNAYIYSNRTKQQGIVNIIIYFMSNITLHHAQLYDCMKMLYYAVHKID